jgi:integrase
LNFEWQEQADYTLNPGDSGPENRVHFKERERQKARNLKAEVGNASGAPETFKQASLRYWEEVGQHQAGADTILRNLIRLEDHLGDIRLDKIDNEVVARVVTWRRAHHVGGRDLMRDPEDRTKSIPSPLIANATVNRSTTELLQHLMTRARKLWRIALPFEPTWPEHMLKEPKECVREVRASEENTLVASIRPDYLPLVDFARASGLRLTECLMKKDQVDLLGGSVYFIGKGGDAVAQPITSEMRRILMAAIANPTDHVFTYVAARTRKGEGGWLKGDRLPITASGLKTMWRRARRNKTGARLPADLRFHDLRHDFATKLLRETKNLRLVQKALHHKSVTTTTKYAHVHDEEVAAGMEAAAKSRAKSRKASEKSSK